MPDDASGSDDRDASPAGTDVSGDVMHERLDAAFALLSNRRCRYALYHLDSSSVDVFDVEELVDAVVEWERETGAADSDATAAESHHRSVSVALNHDCLPRLADFGAAEYDRRSKTVRYHESCDLSAYLRLSAPFDER